MIIPEKIFTDNPFVDNILYYAKLLALNCVVKDTEEALKYETAESAFNGDAYIACIENNARYDIFPMIPKEILEKYIAQKSNLDLYLEDPDALEIYFRTFSDYKRVELFTNISKLCRTIYINHYNIMKNYLKTNNNNYTWLSDNEELYNKCILKTVNYEEVYGKLPLITVRRILKQYLTNYNMNEFEDISKDMVSFKTFMINRTDASVEVESLSISEAMRAVFISHYTIMKNRGYMDESHKYWLDVISDEDVLENCKTSKATYKDLYSLFPVDELKNIIKTSLGDDAVNNYNTYLDITILEAYLVQISTDTNGDIIKLNNYMRQRYIDNYNKYMSIKVYNQCVEETVDYWYLNDFMPKEALKIILSTYIKEVSNLEMYEKDKSSLDAYLNNLPILERNTIKESINNDMLKWYPNNYLELNTYYRALIGLPPLSEDKKPFLDTLTKTYSSNTNSFIEFGDRFLSLLSDNNYSINHWMQPICEFDSYDISLLEEYGILDQYKEACKRENKNDIFHRYSYLNYLSDYKLDIYTCRKATRFQLIGVPTINDLEARNKFISTYDINRTYVMKTIYTESYKYLSEYYDKFMIVFILINTIMDMLSNIPEYIIDREVFDSRCIKALFESFGIPYFAEIPLKYQRAMLKNLNTLIKYKSSSKNMIDICSLFGFNDINLFNYYLFKTKKVDKVTGQYLFPDNSEISYNRELLYIKDNTASIGEKDFNGENYVKVNDLEEFKTKGFFKIITVIDNNGNEIVTEIMNNDIDFYIKNPEDNTVFHNVKELQYFKNINADTSPSDLKFIRVPVSRSITAYKNDNNYINSYDEITFADKGNTWDGGLIHNDLKKKILDYEFNAVRSKYISIETVTDLTEIAFEVTYFFNMLFDNFYSEDNLTINIPHLKVGHKFKLMDVICYLFSMMYMYNGLSDNIMYSPTQILYVKGYNFNSAITEVMNSSKFFQIEDPISEEYLPLSERYSNFDINERIAKDGYDYREAFENYRITAFNLGADIDELDKWLNDNYHITLDDIIVDDSLTEFKQIITMRNFFTINNSYYQKNIFTPEVNPKPINQILKYAYNYELNKRYILKDINNKPHSFVNINDNRYECIDNNDNEIYVMDYDQYIVKDSDRYTPYIKYNITATGNYKKISSTPHILHNETEYKSLFPNDNISIRNSDYKTIYADNHFYRKLDGNFEEITNAKYFESNPFDNTKKVLLFGEYYIKNSEGKWILNPNNCYVVTIRNGVRKYILYSEIGDSFDDISEDDCYVKRGTKFIKLSDTDFYKQTHDPTNDSSIEFIFNEEECYVVTTEETEFYDPDANPRVYYMKLSVFYNNNSVLFSLHFFVKTKDGRFIPEIDLIHPTNCYYKDEHNNYNLVIYNTIQYTDYVDKFSTNNIMVLQKNYEYNALKINSKQNYIKETHLDRVYVYNSNLKYFVSLIPSSKYTDSNKLLVLFNKYVDPTTPMEDINNSESNKYDIEAIDTAWDENDWFYIDPNSSAEVGMNGEITWYHNNINKPLNTNNSLEKRIIGSGFYLESSYLGSIEITEGSKYYMSFDLETNFKGIIQVCCEADSECEVYTDRNYFVAPETPVHINQVFKANNVKRPKIKVLIFNYDDYPIHIGDYIVIKNIKFMKSYSDNFIAQDIPSFAKLQELYCTNRLIYKHLIKLMTECGDYRKYQMYKGLYDALMISKYNKEAFRLTNDTYAKTYTDFLQVRDSVLYDRLIKLKDMEQEVMRKEIADDIVEITYILDTFIDSEKIKNIYSYLPAVSSGYIQQYIYKVINFFKSWKVHLLSINTVYKLSSQFENTVKILEKQSLRNKIGIDDNVFIYDGVKISPIDAVSPNGKKYTDIFHDMITENLKLKEYCSPKERIRIIATSGNTIKYYDTENEMHILFENDDIKIIDDDNELIINSSNAGFTEVNNNELLMKIKNISENISQSIDNITYRSADYYKDK